MKKCIETSALIIFRERRMERKEKKVRNLSSNYFKEEENEKTRNKLLSNYYEGEGIREVEEKKRETLAIIITSEK